MAKMTTLCYIEHDGKYLMLYRNKKENDINEGKWIGVGGHFEGTESPDECLIREVKEETGLTIFSYQFRGIITFIPKPGVVEYMCLYTADGYKGELKECDEGELRWVKKSEIENLNLWEGDRLFMTSMRRLHTEVTDPLEIIAWREVFIYLEKCCDACEHVADVVESVMMKNS